MKPQTHMHLIIPSKVNVYKVYIEARGSPTNEDSSQDVHIPYGSLGLKPGSGSWLQLPANNADPWRQW